MFFDALSALIKQILSHAVVVYYRYHTLNKISNWSPFKLIISDHALIISKRPGILPKYVQFNGQKFSLSEMLSFNPHFLGSAFWKKNGFERSFYQIKVQLVINLSSRLRQRLNTRNLD